MPQLQLYNDFTTAYTNCSLYYQVWMVCETILLTKKTAKIMDIFDKKHTKWNGCYFNEILGIDN